MSDADRQSKETPVAGARAPGDAGESRASGSMPAPTPRERLPGAPAPGVAGAEESPEPEAPLRDLEEFTDADPERADWPDGTEDPDGPPKAG